MKKALKKTGKSLSKPAASSRPPTKSLTKKPMKAKGKEVVKVAATSTKSLRKAPPPPPAAPKTGPIPEVPKSFKWKGKKAKGEAWKHMLHVKMKDMPSTFPKPHKAVPEGTVWRIDPKNWRNDPCLVTVDKQGVHLAWATCAVCHNIAFRCICKKGFIHPRSIELIVIKSEAREAGEDWTTLGRIDSTRWEITTRALYWYKGRETGYISTGEAPRRPVAGMTAPVQVQPREQAADRPVGARKTLRKSGAKSLSKGKTVQEPLPTMEQLDQGAEKTSKDLLAEMEKRLTKKPMKKTIQQKRMDEALADVKSARPKRMKKRE